MNTPQLTPKQDRLLQFIQGEIARRGRSPTLREIAAHFGFKAIGTVQSHLRALQKKGALAKRAGEARGLLPSDHAESWSAPILGAVPAGSPREAIADARGFVTVCGRKPSGDHYALRVVGESMRDAGILEGDTVLVRAQPEAAHGDVVVAMVDGEATVKTLERRAGRLRLLPANPRFSPIELTAARENRICGKVVALFRKF